MKRLALLLVFVACAVPGASAQEDEQVQIGVFANYFRASQTSTNFAGLGGRFAFNVFHDIKLEGEAAYDFNKAFSETFSEPGTGLVELVQSNLRVLHGMAGPKVGFGRGRIRPFVTVKGGGMSFLFDNRPASVSGFISNVQSLRASNVNAVLYPGGGLEGKIGPVGLRLDVGDEVYFNSGAHNNLRVAFGPFIQF